MCKILIVDDVDTNRMILADILEDDYEVEEAADGLEALEILEGRTEEFGLVLLDLVMPKMDGYEVLECMDNKGWLERLPVIVISGEAADAENRTLGMRAVDFIRKPFDANIVVRRVANVYQLYELKRSLEDKVEAQTEALRRQNEQIEMFNDNMVDLLGTIVEYRHTESGDHIHRVKTFTELLARKVMEELPEYGLTEEDVERIASASVLHDLGKVTIPDSILLKPGKLTQEEYDTMKNHTVRGGDFVRQIHNTWDEAFSDAAYEISRHHHERFDGRGYPDGLVGDAIPLSAQIVSIADVYEALAADRVYKKAYEPAVAFKMILDGECGVFNPKLIECLKSLEQDFEAVVKKQRGSVVLG